MAASGIISYGDAAARLSMASCRVPAECKFECDFRPQAFTAEILIALVRQSEINGFLQPIYIVAIPIESDHDQIDHIPVPGILL